MSPDENTITDIRHDDSMRRLFVLETKMDELCAKMDDFSKAFPGNDLEGHRRYHTTMIEMLEERRRLRVTIQEKTISGLVWGLLVFLAFSAWEYVQRRLGVR